MTSENDELDIAEVLNGLLNAIQVESNSDVLLYTGLIHEGGEAELRQQYEGFIPEEGRNLIFILTTNGGDPDTAFRITRRLKKCYHSVTILICSQCKSAGTLMALGADELVMTVDGELGPLDMQLRNPEELAETSSALTPEQALNTLRNRACDDLVSTFLRLRLGSQIPTRTALNVATELTQGLLAPIYGQIDPIRLGEISRAQRVGSEYAARLKTNNVRDTAINRLLFHYPSHGFVIDAEEAETLFQTVRAPSDAELELLKYLQLHTQLLERGYSPPGGVSVWLLSLLLVDQAISSTNNDVKTGSRTEKAHAESEKSDAQGDCASPETKETSGGASEGYAPKGDEEKG